MNINDVTKIKNVQKLLGLDCTGTIDDHTAAAIKNFNLRNNKGSSNLLTEETYNEIVKKLSKSSELLYSEDDTDDESELDCTTDLSETDASFETYMLDKDEYVTSKGKILKKEYIFLHHTSGWSNPYSTVDDWNKDSRGAIGTNYVIGGFDIKTNKSNNDGKIIKCIPDEYFAWHLGSTSKDKINMHMHIHSVGIEICNMGYLIKKGDSFFTYTGARVPDNHVEDLGFKFRGYQYWQKYTEDQIDSTYALIKSIGKKHNIDLNLGLKEWLKTSNAQKAFEFNEMARDGKIKGVLSHTNVRKDKTDVSPQKLLVEMINSL